MAADIHTDLTLGGLTKELLEAKIYYVPETVEAVISELKFPSTCGAILVCSMWLKACKGDVNAAKLLREMNGEGSAVLSDYDLSSMSEASLLELAGEGF